MGEQRRPSTLDTTDTGIAGNTGATCLNLYESGATSLVTGVPEATDGCNVDAVEGCCNSSSTSSCPYLSPHVHEKLVNCAQELLKRHDEAEQKCSSDKTSSPLDVNDKGDHDTCPPDSRVGHEV